MEMGELIAAIAVVILAFLFYRTRLRRGRHSHTLHGKTTEQTRGSHSIMLVELTPDQIEKAKAENGRRKQITHALLCGSFGQMFGTEKQCRKYFDVWRPEYRIEVQPGHFKTMFPDLFSKGLEVNSAEIQDYRTTQELVTKLIYAQDNAGQHR